MGESQSPAELVEKAENDTSLRWGNQRAELFSNAARIIHEAGKEEDARKLFWDSLLFNMSLIGYNRKTKSRERFAPLVGFSNGEVFPDKRKFIKEQLEYYRTRAESVRNPILKARYYDILWELEGDHVSARKAIDEYLACVPIYLGNGWESEIADSLTRSLALSSTLNDMEKIGTVRTEILRTIETLASQRKYRYLLEIINACVDYNTHFREEDFYLFIKYLQEAVDYYRKEVKDGFNLERAFLQTLMDVYKLVSKEDESQRCRKEIAESYENESEWKFHNYPQGASISAAIIQEAIKSYSEIGDAKKVEVLKRLLKERTEISVEKEMVTISVPIEIPGQAIQALVQRYTSLSLNDSLTKIIGDDLFIPNIDSIRRNVSTQKDVAPLSFIVPRVSIRNDNPVLVTTTDEEILEEHVLGQVAMSYMLYGGLLNEVIDALMKEKGLDAESLINFLSGFNLYDEDRLQLIKVGLKRYFEGDYVSSIHVLVPQIEAALRKILGKIGKSTTVYNNEVLQERTLDNIIRIPELKEHIGENLWYYLKVFLVDKVGDNLRNDVSHGLIEYQRCNKTIATLIIHILLILNRYEA